MKFNKINAEKIGKNLFWIILFPFFFILHGYNENFGLISPNTLFVLFIKYVLISLIIYALSFLLFRNTSKAFLYSFYLLCTFFFFGSFHDFLKEIIPLNYFSSYRLLLPSFFITYFIVFILLRRSKRISQNLINYCAILLISLTGLEFASFTIKYFSKKNYNNLAIDSQIISVADSCSTKKPDIFFIILDGYTSSDCLQNDFSFSNSDLDSILRQYNFFISTGSKSNYNVTPFSLSSTLDMNYLKKGIEKEKYQDRLLLKAMATFKDNRLTKFLKAEGYQIKNFGCFDFKDVLTTTKAYFDYLPFKQIDDQTLYSRVVRDIGWNISTKHFFNGKFKVPKSYLKTKNYHIYRNKYNWEQLMEETGRQSDMPRFIYAHLMLPHEPFYLDSTGGFVSDTAIILNSINLKVAYVQQVMYVNGLLKELIPLIVDKKSRERVVILQGDHGFRLYEKEEREKEFLNLNAYFFSDSNYSMLYKTISPVNSFRVVLNKYFCQSFPLLKDSSIYLRNRK